MRFAFSILVAAAAAYALGFFLAVPANPEVKFWRDVVERRDREIAQVRKNQPGTPIIFFTGGSSTAFSIDPAIIEQTCGLPSFNLGLPVAARAEYLIHQAMERTRSGDLLILCLEPDLLSVAGASPSPSKFSFAMAAVSGSVGEAAGGHSFDAYPSLRDYLNLSRPGAGHLSTYIARLALDKPYRYTHADMRYRGRIETAIHGAIPAGIRTASQLSPYGRQLLTRARQAADERGVRLLYAMPWHFTGPAALPDSRRHQHQLNQEISTIIPVIDDGFTGVAGNPSWFSDTGQHLTSEGSRERSTHLAAALRECLSSH
jgi:hypothetical protein